MSISVKTLITFLCVVNVLFRILLRDYIEAGAWIVAAIGWFNALALEQHIQYLEQRLGIK